MQSNWSEIITSITGLTSIGMVAGFVYIGRRLQILDDLEKTSEKIKLNLKVVSDYLTHANVDFNHSELRPYSPLQLTKEGQKLIKEVGFDTVFSEHKADFFICVDSQEPKLKYDVEAAAIKSISVLADKDYMSFLKVFFYNTPQRSLQNTAPTLGVYIRDKYLEEHPEISE